MWENIGGLGLLEAVNVKRGHWINGEEPVEEALVCLDWVMGSQQSFTLKWSDRCSLQKDNSGDSMGDEQRATWILSCPAGSLLL